MSLINRILCPVKFDRMSGRLLKIADTLAGHFKAELYVVHVLPTLPSYGGPGLPEQTRVQVNITQEVREAMLHASIANDTPNESNNTTVLVASGDIVDNVVDLAESLDVELIVMGESGQTSHTENGASGSQQVLPQVINRVPCPVLTTQELAQYPAEGCAPRIMCPQYQSAVTHGIPASNPRRAQRQKQSLN